MQDRVTLEVETTNSCFVLGKVCLDLDDCFSFTKDQFSGGDIHIWDQESGALLHSIRAQAHGGDLTCIAWNNAADDPFMFAAGSHDGGVKVWTRPDLLNSTSIHDCPRTSSPEQMDSGKNFQ